MTGNKEIGFIINPIAGRRKHRDIESYIAGKLDSKWIPHFATTERAGHAKELVAGFLAKGITHIVAVGGDGTVNEVACIVFEANATLGIIPCGSGNGLARSLKIPVNIDGAINCLNGNNHRSIDVGAINDKKFFCTCGVGFDAKIGRKFAKQKKRGFATYVKTTIKEYTRYSPKRYKIKIDEKKVVRKAFLVTIANAGQYGNNAFIAPKAEMDDGVLEVCVLKPFPFIKSIALGFRLFAKTFDRSRYLEIIQGRTVVFKKKKKWKFHIDGDPVKLKGPVKIDVIPSSLKVIAGS